MQFKRGFVTPVLTWVSIFVGLSGVMMFFHIFDGYIAILHEVLGLVCVIFTAIHLVINWKSLKNYFGKKVFILSAILVLVLSASLIIIEMEHPPVHVAVMKGLAKAHVSASCLALGVNYSEAVKVLEKNGITVGDSKTIKEICIKNGASVGAVLDLIVN